MSRGKGVFFFLAWLGMVLYFTQRWILGPVIPALMREFQVDKTLLGVVGSASLWGYMFTPILAGVLSDRFGRKFDVMLGVTGFSALTLLCGLLNSPTQLIVVRFFNGAVEAFFFVPLIAYTLELFPERPGFYLTLMSSGSSLGWFTGPALSGWLLTISGSWRTPFVVTGICGLLLAALLLSAWPTREGPRPTGALFDRTVLRGRNLALLSLLSLVFALDLAAEFGFTMWYPAYLELERQMTTAAAGTLAGLYGVGQFCGRPVMGWASDRLAYRPVGIAGAAVLGISLALILRLQSSTLLGVFTFQAGFIGAAVMGFLMWARHHWVWWPTHYLGFPIGATLMMNWTWFSIFIGWMLKGVILQYGGVTFYRRLRPLFLGLILGHVFASGFWVVFDFVTGETGNRIPVF